MTVANDVAPPPPTPVLHVSGVSKQYSGVQALNGVGFDLYRGQVLALAGHNGAGKSTLIGVLAGAKRPDAGLIKINGSAHTFADPGQARDAGIGVCYQEPLLIPQLSVAANVYLKLEGPKHSIHLNRREISRKFARLTERTGIHLPADAIIENLSVAQKQLTQILRALAGGANIVVLDEPTAALSPQDRTALFTLIRNLSQAPEPTSFVIVSHFLEELEENCDAAVVLRNGKVVATIPTPPTARELSHIMAGAQAETLDHAPSAPATPGETLLDVKNLTLAGCSPINLTVKSGEIIGFAGLVGSGRTELLRAIALASGRTGGTVSIDGHPVRNGGGAIENGLALMPEDRRDALVMDWPIWKNIALKSPTFIVHPTLEKQRAQDLAQRCRVIASSLTQRVQKLSGGNAQKVVFAKLLASDFKVALLDEPTHGVDVHAKAEIFGIIDDLAAQGRGFIVVAAEFDDVLRMATTIYSVHKGELVARHSNRSSDATVTADQLLFEAATGRPFAANQLGVNQ